MQIDDKQIRDVQQKMQECIKAMRKLAPMVGIARQVKEFSSDQRKNALAEVMIEYLQKGDSAAAAEVAARSNPKYTVKIQELGKDYGDACGTIAEWEAVFARFEAARSIHA